MAWPLPVGGGDKAAARAYTDHTRVMYYLDDARREQPVKTPEDWARRRRDILAGMQEAMGPLPDRSNLPPLDPKVTAEEKGEGFTKQTISFVAEKGATEDRIPAFLFLPTNRPAGKKLPAILALHPTSPLGKASVTGEGKANREYGLELAQRGYVVLCPDYTSFGDYAKYDFQAAFKSGRYKSGTMKGIFNHMRCVDFLQSREEVDPKRIGVIGHSLGGHNSMFVAAFDDRIGAIVSSCGWTPFGDYYKGKIAGWTSDRYMPSLRDVYELNAKAVPFDFYEIVAALAPRPFFSVSPLHDSNFDVDGVRKGIAAAKPVYELLGAPDALQVRYPDCQHDFPIEMRKEAYAFLDAALKFEPPAAPNDQPKGDTAPDLKSELPRIPPHEPADALQTIKVLPGFRVEQVAAEPLVCSPVACDFDENGKLYVIEMIDYGEGKPGEPVGRVSLLEDTDGDGKYDKSTVFAENIPWPTAVLCYDGGIFVGAAPDIYYLKDTRGGGKADVKKVVFTGFGRTNVQGLLNSFRWGLDNRVHGATSTCGGKVFRPEQGEARAVNLNGRDFSFDPKLLDLRPESGGAQHGMCFDDWGRKFVTSNSDHLQMVMFEDRYVARNPYLAAPGARQMIAADGPQAKVFRISPIEPWRIVRTRLRVTGVAPGLIEGGGQPAGYFTGATGATVYRGDAWPAEYRGQVFIGDVGSNIVHRKVLEPDGVGLIGRRVDEAKEFLASSDIWFRPAQFANAPDGTLHVLDIYREVIEHPHSLPPMIKQYLDLSSGRERGRIYRIVPDDFRQRPLPKLGQASTAELVATLEHRNGWHRDTASRLLFQRHDTAAIAPLIKLAMESKLPEGRLHALQALASLGALSPDVVAKALADENARVRERAIELAEAIATKSPEVRAKLISLADDPDARVRYQVAFSLGDVSDPGRAAALAKLLRRDGGDKWVRLAVFTSLSEGSGPMLADLAADKDFRTRSYAQDVLAELALQAGARGRAEDVSAAAGAIEALPAEDAALAAALMKGLAQGSARSGAQLRDKLADGGKARALLTEMLTAAQRTAADRKQKTAPRAEALRTLALGPLAQSRAILVDALSSQQPREVQLAAVASLDHMADPQVAPILVEAWSQFSPKLRQAAGDALYARPQRLAALLEAVEKGKIPLTDLNPSRLRVAAEGNDAAVRERAKAVLAKIQLGRRADVVEAYKGALSLKGDPAKGKLAFQKTCTTCHRLERVGEELGPNLVSMQARGAEAILVNVLDPNREVNPQYVEYVVVTTDGVTLTGLLAAESATSITLKRAQGESDTILRSEIQSMRSTSMSLMPEGLEQQLDQQAMADLIAYIMTVK